MRYLTYNSYFISKWTYTRKIPVGKVSTCGYLYEEIVNELLIDITRTSKNVMLIFELICKIKYRDFSKYNFSNLLPILI